MNFYFFIKLDKSNRMDIRMNQRKSRHIDINDHEWFFRLRENDRDTGLEGYYGAETLSKGIIIAVDVKNKYGNFKRFAYFKTIDQFIEHMNKYPTLDWHFYELIGGTTKGQKPYFDIDINTYKLFINNYKLKLLQGGDEKIFGEQSEDMILKIVSCIEQKMIEFYGIKLEEGDISIYQTIYPNIEETKNDIIYKFPKKFSYHIVIQNYYFSDDRPMNEFGTAIKNCIDGPMNIIDVIWDVTRQFRCLHSQKIGSTSKKELMCFDERKDETNILKCMVSGRKEGEIVDKISELHKSFVTNIKGCQILNKIK